MRFIHPKRWVIAGALLLLVLPGRASVTPDRAAELRQRFEEGCRLAGNRQFQPALDIFATILAQDPDARGSLLMSGIVHSQQHRFAEALPFFERFARLEPNHEQGLIGAVKAFHGAGRMAEAEPYRLRLQQLRRSGKSEKLKALASYEREVIPLGEGNWISVQEYFDEADYRPKWGYLLMKDEKSIARRLQLNRMPEAEAKVARASNPTLKPGPVYVLSEAIHANGEFQRTKIHRIVSGSATYVEVREMALNLMDKTRTH